MREVAEKDVRIKEMKEDADKSKAMKEVAWGWLKPAGAAAVLLLILLRPEASVAGGQRAMRTWYASVAPALFPFLALMPVLTSREARTFYSRAFGGVLRMLGLPGEAAPAVLIGMIAGSPGGAVAVRRVAQQTGMKRQDACRLGLAVCGMSPAYLVIGVGQGMLGSAALGFRLAGIQFCVQLILLLCLGGFRFADDEAVERLSEEAAAAGGLRQAVESVLGICGCMVIFGSVTAAAASLIGDGMGTALLAVCDGPGGLAALSSWVSPQKEMVMCAVAGFGGLCIAVQNVDALRPLGVKMRQYLCVRGAAALLMAALGSIMLHETVKMDSVMLNPMQTYASSMLCAGIFAVPSLVFLSKKPILNNGKLN